MAIEADTCGHPMDALDPETSGHPQPGYKALRDVSAVAHLDGVGHLVSTRAAVEQVLHNPGVFSSRVPAGSLGTERPLIPLNIDPPDHRKYRKLLDPLFAPHRMKLLEEPAGLHQRRSLPRYLPHAARQLDLSRDITMRRKDTTLISLSTFARGSRPQKITSFSDLANAART